MDEIKKIITINVEQAEASLKNVKDRTDEASQSFNSLKDYKKHIEKLTASLLDLEQGSQEYSDVVSQIHDAQEKLNTVMKDTASVNQAAEGSYNALAKQMAELKKQWKETTDEAERNSLGEQILDINNQLKDMDASIGNYQRNVGNYEGAFVEAFKSMTDAAGGLGGGIGNVANTTKKMMPVITAVTKTATTGINGIRKAIASTGIGALITGAALAIQKLTELIQKNKEAEEAEKKRQEETRRQIEETNKKREGEISKLREILGIQKEYEQSKAWEFIEEHSGEGVWKRNIEGITKLFKTGEISAEEAAERWDWQIRGLGDDMTKALTTVFNAEMREIVEANKAAEEARQRAAEQAAANRKSEAEKAAAQKAAELQKIEELQTASTDRLLEDKNRELTQLERTYKENLSLFEKYQKDTTALTEAYNADRAAIEKKYNDAAVEEARRVAEEKQRAIEEAQASAGAKGDSRLNAVNKEYELEEMIADATIKLEFEKNQKIFELEDERLNKRKAILEELINSDDLSVEKKQEYADALAEVNAQIVANAEAGMDAQKAHAQDLINTYSQAAATIGSMVGEIASFWQDSIKQRQEAGEINDAEAEKEFENSKKLQIASATINGLAGIATAIATAMSLGPIAGPIVGAINAAAVATSMALQIAKIKSTSLKGSGGGSSSTSASSATPSTNASQTYTPNYTQNVTGQSEEENLENAIASGTSRGTQDIKCYVVESDIRQAGNKVQVRENEATF